MLLLKSILNLNGVHTFNKQQQKEVKGGFELPMLAGHDYTCKCGNRKSFIMRARSLNHANRKAHRYCGTGQSSSCNIS